MSEEEKKAIKMIKEQKEDVEHGIRAMECTPEDYDEDTYNDYVEWSKNANTILILIEKQNKRLEQLEKENEEYRKDYVEYKKQEPQQLSIKKLAEEILKLKEENTRLRIENSAISTVLEKENKELKESHDYIYEAYQDAGKKMFDYQEQLDDSIPKSVIREKLEELEANKNMNIMARSSQINILEELLGGSNE